MFKKLDFKGLNYKDLDRFGTHDQKRENMHNFYQTFDFLNLVTKWPDIIGQALAKVTSPMKIKGDSLIIVSKHASYSQNISFLSEEIKQKIFAYFPELKPVIRKLNFITQEGFFKEQEIVLEKEKNLHKMHPQDPKVKVLKIEAERLFAEVEDKELKEILTSIFMQSK